MLDSAETSIKDYNHISYKESSTSADKFFTWEFWAILGRERNFTKMELDDTGTKMEN